MAGAIWNYCHLGAFCVHHTAMHHVTSCKATDIRHVHACLDATCHLRFWQNDLDRLRATAAANTRDGTDTETRVSTGSTLRAPLSGTSSKEGCRKPVLGVCTGSWPWRRKFSRRSCRDSNPGRPFNHESDSLAAELSPLAGPAFQSRVRRSNRWAIPVTRAGLSITSPTF